MKHDPVRILLVDDDEDDYLLVHELFGEIHHIRFELEWARTYREALDAFAHRQHEAYLLDNYLGEHTGMDLLREMVAQGCLAPIIMLTGQGDRALDLEAMEAGATDYLVKGRLNADLLERSIRYAIAHKQAEKALVQKTEALERSNQELEMFNYVVSHDLQAPLRTIGGFASLLQQSYQGRLDAEADRYIAFIVEGALRMQTLIKDVLAYSREGRHAIERQRIDVNEVLRQTLESLRATLDEQEAVVTHDPLPTIEADTTQIGRLLQNLIGNGVKFRGQARPRVHVSAKREGGMWCFSVQDNGIGIDRKYQDRIFEVFERLHNESAYEGTGIGLAICKKIVEGHGGHIWVTSDVGQGATFHFTIPKYLSNNNGLAGAEGDGAIS